MFLPLQLAIQSARRPCHGAPTEKMKVQVLYSLPAACGIEATEDLIADVDQALAAV